MLDPWIIEEIRRREEEQRQQENRPVLELPLDVPQYPEQGGKSPEPQPGEERGVTIVDFSI